MFLFGFGNERKQFCLVSETKDNNFVSFRKLKETQNEIGNDEINVTIMN